MGVQNRTSVVLYGKYVMFDALKGKNSIVSIKMGNTKRPLEFYSWTSTSTKTFFPLYVSTFKSYNVV